MDTVKDYEAKIRMLYSELRKSEKKVADYILLNKELRLLISRIY